ncbi:formate/nitrite transporter family protein [Aerococcus sp. Group 1]|uniref:formate/nitrite transporter family protein n=1 Tax=Aerococcus urinae (strain CCUG 59500 / ACS-120-V-Col10a) TaxID=2976812 RepID=UPI00227C805A|nr:formate/nitrite transporter family protein [Aerococcus sp. Group 1]MCY3031682.1 formate/nitrite transporter family protein [Aerococcus sp. Group 1]
MAYINGKRPEKGILGPLTFDNVEKKTELFDKSFWRYALRSVYATLFLTFGTAIAMMTAQQANLVAPGLGKFTFAFFFAWSLVLIIYMNGELATANMNFLVVGARKKYISWQKAFKILMVCVLFNFIGGLVCAYIFSKTTIFQDLPADHYLFTAVSGKFVKSALTIFIEGILANIIVNSAVVASNRMVNADGRVYAIIFIIFIFAFLGYEHVIANFVSFPLAFFSNGGPVDGMTLANVLKNFVFTFLGNLVGGGFVIGFVYSWLGDKETSYVD